MTTRPLLFTATDAEAARRFLSADETHVVSLLFRGGAASIDVCEIGVYRIDRAEAKLSTDGTLVFDPHDVVAFAFEDAGPSYVEGGPATEEETATAAAIEERLIESDALIEALMKAGIESRDKAVKEAALRLRDLRAEVDSILNQNAPETEGAPS